MNRLVIHFLPTLSRLLASVLALTGVGCIPIPVPMGAFSKPPFPPAVLQTVSRSGADKHLVRRTLGPPLVVKSGGRYWFYAGKREAVGIIGSHVVFEDYQWVVIRFDADNRVIFVEHNNSFKGCLSNGICHFAGLFSTRPSTTVITAPTVEDAAAKSYPVRADECTVYLFLERAPRLMEVGSVTFFVDGQAQGIVNDKTYLFLTHPRGEITVSAYQFKISRPCRGGEKLYVRATKALDWSWETGKDLSPVDGAAGETEIRSRRLALPD